MNAPATTLRDADFHISCHRIHRLYTVIGRKQRNDKTHLRLQGVM